MNETDTYKRLKDKPRDNYPEYYIIHHTGGTEGNPMADTSHHTAKDIERWHLSKGWEGLGYQFVIDQHGFITKGRPEHYHGAHCKINSMNVKSIGICLSGNFDVTYPTEEQKNSLRRLLSDLRGLYPAIMDSHIVPHRYFNKSKSCWGNKLSDNWARKLVEVIPVEPFSIKKSLLRIITELIQLLKHL